MIKHVSRGVIKICFGPQKDSDRPCRYIDSPAIISTWCIPLLSFPTPQRLLLPLPVLSGGRLKGYSNAKMGVEIETITPGDGEDNTCFSSLFHSFGLYSSEGNPTFPTFIYCFLFFRTDIPEEGTARRGALCR